MSAGDRCPRCAGSGETEEGGTCSTCGGSGEITPGQLDLGAGAG